MRLPNDGERHAIYGQTGSGKTVFALWCLSQRSYDKMPWVIIDAKLDPTIEKIPRLEEIDVSAKPPKSAGLFTIRPSINDFDDGIVTGWLMRAWAQERIGIMIDEGYMFNPRDRGLKTVLTQGRSKKIPMICLSQKPSWISPFIHSESEFKSVFFLDMPADIDRVREWIPEYEPYSLPKHGSYWRSTSERVVAVMGPCPKEEVIFDTFDNRVKKKRLLNLF
jgi:hypothetical protein